MQIMFVLRLRVFSHIWTRHSSRHYASLSPHSLGSNRGFRKKDDSPGTEAIFNQELRKMKDVVGQGLDPDLEGDAIQQQETLQKVTQDYSKRGSAMKYAKRAKYLGIEQQEKRSLTWDNIDKVRYLRQEHPEEWSISQLAASFEVSEMAIKKVLKSKYTPNSKTRRLHDLLVLNNTGREKKVKFSVETSIILNDDIQNTGSPVFGQKNNDDQSSPTEDNSIINHQEKQATNIPKMVNLKDTISRTDEQREDDWEDVTDSSLEDELEEAEAFSAITASDFIKVSEEGECPPKMIQKGREFYDSDGEFLFKI